MVFGNVPKLHALVGLLAATAAFPAGCSNDDFEGCEASRTCKPKNTGGASGSSGTSGGGEGGDDAKGGTSGTSSGGASGSGTGQSGEAGAMDGGRGGAGDDTTPPTIVSITPDDGDTDVERDVEVTVTFSEPIDEGTVTRRSVVLEGPDGEVAGTLGADGRVVTFVAEKPLYLLGDYTVTVGDSVADLAGNTIGEVTSVGWKVRDGRWSEPVYPFGKTVPRVVAALERNARGDIVVGMEPLPAGPTVYGASYFVNEKRWSSATDLRSMAGVAYHAYGAGIDAVGRSVVSWGGYNNAGYGWSRLTGEGTWTSAGTLSGFADVGVTSEGSATAVWLDASSNELMNETRDLSDGTLRPAAPLMLPDINGSVRLVASMDHLALLTTRSVTGGTELVVAWKTGDTWGAAQPIASAAAIDTFSVDSDEQGNIMVVWREDDEIWSRVYHKADEAWTAKLFVATAAVDAFVGSIDMTAGHAIVSFNSAQDPGTWVAVYEDGLGWVADSIARVDGTWTGAGLALTIDRAGNALAAWRSEFRFRRYVPGEGWTGRSLLDMNVDDYSIWAVGAPDGEIQIVTQSNVDRAPLAVRFE